MKICIIGAGYVGLVTGVCFADFGNEVICVDNAKEKITDLKNVQTIIINDTIPRILYLKCR